MNFIVNPKFSVFFFNFIGIFSKLFLLLISSNSRSPLSIDTNFISIVKKKKI
ncbi:hypothetical protein AXX17_AT1G26950 [Arabidopsis thaliana]|uniref:Transmembrane protein n=1 Tax=Arabidopsis thaliana TaxID=3702 RepID=A0A178WNT2_ARATH|nr:hypothetical protein AXX17_AT1G26950 [Arabidopsis thaliana]